MNFDLPAIIDTVPLSEAGAVCKLIGLDGAPLINRREVPMTLTLLGPDSAAFHRAVREENAAAVARAEKKEEAHHDAFRIGLFSRITIAWGGFDTEDGEQIAPTRENLVALYTRAPAILDQAENFQSRRINFTKASLTS